MFLQTENAASVTCFVLMKKPAGRSRRKSTRSAKVCVPGLVTWKRAAHRAATIFAFFNAEQATSIFPHIVSSIYLPLWAEEISGDITAVLEQPHFWALFQQRTVGGKVDPIVCQTVASITGVDSAKLAIAAERKLQGGVTARASSATGDEEDFRRSEYQAICDGKVGPSKRTLR